MAGLPVPRPCVETRSESEDWRGLRCCSPGTEGYHWPWVHITCDPPGFRCWIEKVAAWRSGQGDTAQIPHKTGLATLSGDGHPEEGNVSPLELLFTPVTERVSLLRVRGLSEQHWLTQSSFVTASLLCECMERCWQLPSLSRSMLLEQRPSSVGSISLSTVIHVPQACPHSIAPNFHAYSSARIKDLTSIQMDSSERCISSTASSRAH